MGIYQLPKIIGKDKKPPFGARVNWHHPLSQGLVGAWLLNEYGGKIAFDCVNNMNGSFAGVTYPTRDSYGIKTDPGYITIPNNTIQACTAVTMVTKFNISAADGEMWAFSKASAFSLGVDTTSWYAFAAPKWGNYVSLAGAPTQKVDTVLAASGDASGLSLYKDGKLIASNTTAMSPTLTEPITIGSYVASDNMFNGIIYFAYLYNRRLSAIEHLSLAVNPYQMFLHPIYDVYFTGEAAPPPTGGKSIFGYDSIFHAGGIIQT